MLYPTTELISPVVLLALSLDGSAFSFLVASKKYLLEEINAICYLWGDHVCLISKQRECLASKSTHFLQGIGQVLQKQCLSKLVLETRCKQYILNQEVWQLSNQSLLMVLCVLYTQAKRFLRSSCLMLVRGGVFELQLNNCCYCQMGSMYETQLNVMENMRVMEQVLQQLKCHLW